MLERDISETLQQQVHSAIGNGAPLKIEGGNSKAFLGRESHGEILDISYISVFFENL